MRNGMRQLLFMGALLVDAVTAIASSLENKDWVFVSNDCCSTKFEDAASEDESSLGNSQQTSNSTTPVKKLTTFPVPTRDESFETRQSSFLSDCGTRISSSGVTNSPSDCGTRISSSDVRKSPSDCGTRISSSDVKKDTRGAALLLRAMTSRKSLDDFFDKHGNAIDFPTTPLASSFSDSPLKQSSSCRFSLKNLNRP